VVQLDPATKVISDDRGVYLVSTTIDACSLAAITGILGFNVVGALGDADAIGMIESLWV
jgi:hypothetical protein